MADNSNSQPNSNADENSPEKNSPQNRPSPFFPATHWTIIITINNGNAAAAEAALENLCRTYLPAIEAYLRWRRNLPGDPHELANEFLAFFIHHDALKRVDPKKGKFRHYLSGALRNFIYSKWRPNSSAPTMVPCDEFTDPPASDTDADASLRLDQEFAIILGNTALLRVRDRFSDRKWGPHFDTFRRFLTADPQSDRLLDVAAQLGTSVDSVYQHLKRLREEFGRQFRSEVKRHIGPEDDLEEELRALARLYARAPHP